MSNPEDFTSRAGPRDAAIRVAIVAPTTSILGGQAVQAARLVRAWEGDPDVSARLVPINPVPVGALRHAVRVKYARTLATQAAYWPLLFRETRQADLVHVFSASYFSFILAPLPAVLVARALGRPVLLNYRSGEAPDHLRRSRIARRTLGSVDRNVVPSAFLREVFRGLGFDAAVVPNIVDLERFAFRRRKTPRPHLLSTRNFETCYRVDCTLRAFRLVQERRPDATLTLVGGGQQEDNLRRLAAALGLRNVRFVGRVDPGEIHRYYAQADIYVQTPDVDNMPSSILEAFASGVPVVSTNAGGVAAILDDGVHGLLAPPGDHTAVAACIHRLLEEPGLAERMAEQARASCESYTWEQVRPLWLSLYRELLGDATGQSAVRGAA